MFKKVLAAVLLFPLLVACEEEDEGISRGSYAENSNGGKDALLAFYPDFGLRFQIAAGNGRSCAYGRRGKIDGPEYLSCWGRSIHATERDQVGDNVKGPQRMLSIGRDHVCTTEHDLGGGKLHCDGSNSHGQNNDPRNIEINDNKTGHWTYLPKVVASGDNHNCLLDSFGVYCWGDNQYGQTDTPALTDPKWVAAGGNVSCAIDGDNTLKCWGNSEHDQTQVPPSASTASRVSVGSDYVCAVTSGQVNCWGNTSDWDVLPTSYTNVTHISAGAHHACVLDEIQVDPEQLSASCFGKNDPVDLLSVPSVITSNITSISAGNGFSCASNYYTGYDWHTELDGSYSNYEYKGVHCWGDNDEGQTNVPSWLCVGYHNDPIDVSERSCPEY